jgi:hypothetical protein
MKKPKGWRTLALVVTILLMVSCSLSVFIPLSNASWQEVLGVSARVLTLAGDIPSRLFSNADNCTHSMTYWKDHPEEWPVEQLTVGGVDYSKTQILQLLELPPSDYYLIDLAQQLSTAWLNVSKGADPKHIETALDAANDWFLGHPMGSQVDEAEVIPLIDLADSLESYNLGLTGPGMCPDELEALAIDTPEPIVMLPPQALPTMAPTLDSQPSPTGEPGEETLPTRIPTLIEEPSPTETPLLVESPIPSQVTLVLPTLPPTLDAQATPTDEGMVDRATPTPAPTMAGTELGCVHSLEYWLTYPDEWPLDSLQLGQVEIDQEAMLAMLQAPAGDDLTYSLAVQVVLAQLNIPQGADPSGMEQTLQQSQIWFERHPLGSNPQHAGRETGISLIETLAAFNQGLSGSPACEENLATPTPTITLTPLGMPTLPPLDQPSPTPTTTPTDTATFLPTFPANGTPTPTPTITSPPPDLSTGTPTP